MFIAGLRYLGMAKKAAIADAACRTAAGAGRHALVEADNIFMKLTVVEGELSPTRLR
jgi:hypothetical protein